MATWSFIVREMRKRPGRTLLTLLSIVIGVSALVSVRLATSTTRGTYAQMFSSISGKATLQVVSATGGPFPESLLPEVRRAPGVEVATPVVRRTTTLFFEGPVAGESEKRKARVAILGVDPETESRVRETKILQGRLFSAKNEIVLDESFSRSFGAQVGDTVKVASSVGLKPIPFHVVGVSRSSNAASAAQAGAVWASIKSAQGLFRDSKAKLDSIDIVLAANAREEDVVPKLEDLLPDGLEVRHPSTHSHLAEETMLSAEHGLDMARAFSVVLAVFVIANTFLMNVAERRRSLAILRAIGATRSQVVGFLLREALILGIVGSGIGIVAGWGIAAMICRALGALSQVDLAIAWLDPIAMALAVLVGPGMALLGAFVPAYHAASLSPLEAMSWVAPQQAEKVSRRGLIFGAALFIGASIVMQVAIQGWIPVSVSVGAAVVVLIGLVFMLPLILRPLTWLSTAVIRRWMPVEANLARREVLRNRWRTSLTIGVLFIAISTGIGLASSVLDNIRDVRRWYQATVIGDFFVRAFVPDMATGLAADMPKEVGEALRRVPGIERINTHRLVSMRVLEKPTIVVVRDYDSLSDVNFDIPAMNAQDLRRRLNAGEVVMGTVLAHRVGLNAGDQVIIEGESGSVPMPIAALANDYFAGGLALHMSRKVAEEKFGIQGVDVYVVKARPEHRVAVGQALERICRDNGLLLQSYAEIALMIEGMMGGIVASLWALLALGFLVASFGVINTLTMNVLEQTRQLGLLRVVAMTRRQVRVTVLLQALMMGIVGLLPGIAAGQWIAYLINLSTMPVTGHPVEFLMRPVLTSVSLAMAMLIVVLSAWVPAERAARIELSSALQYQ